MNTRRHTLWFGTGLALVVIALMAAPLIVIALWLAPEQRALLAQGGTEWLAALIMLGLLIVVAVLRGAQALVAHFVQPAWRMAEEVSLLGLREGSGQLTAPASPALDALAAAIQRLAGAHATLSEGLQQAVERARADAERERNRLAALIEDLAEAMVVCNAQGRVLLYNHRASRLFAGTGLLGLGRDISALIDPTHLALVRERLADPASPAPGADQRVRFVITTQAGRLVRLRCSALREPESQALSGLVVMAEDVTSEAEQAARRQLALQGLADMQQQGLADLCQQARRMALQEGTPPALATDLAALGAQGVRLAGQLREAMRGEQAWWQASALRDAVEGGDLLRAAQRRIESRLGLTVHVEPPPEPLQLSVDSFLMAQVLAFLATKVWEACDARSITLSLCPHEADALLTLRWSDTALSHETALGWELEPMRLAGEASNLSVREVLAQHAAELHYERDRAATRAQFCLRLTQADPADAAPSPAEVRRMASYDFDLFNWHAGSPADDSRLLADLAFTVFDTETTGLDPAGGDEIIQIGALRILRGKLLRDEHFETLVDTPREIAPESLRIHGISRERLRGQPTTDVALARFHAFAADSVLVGHNVAFDMRFLQIKETQTGLRFDHAVLDTLLLSSVLHPNQSSHRLEAIAERLGVGVFGRHDALADALMTAQIFQRMIPLLAERGIHTLSDARIASQGSPYARVSY